MLNDTDLLFVAAVASICVLIPVVREIILDIQAKLAARRMNRAMKK